MKSLYIDIKNLIPYLLLIAIYFFFVNLEAKNDINNIKLNKSDNESYNDELIVDETINTIRLPVIPFNE